MEDTPFPAASRHPEIVKLLKKLRKLDGYLALWNFKWSCSSLLRDCNSRPPNFWSSSLNTSLSSKGLASSPLQRGLKDAHLVTEHFKSTTQQTMIHFMQSRSHWRMTIAVADDSNLEWRRSRRRLPQGKCLFLFYSSSSHIPSWDHRPVPRFWLGATHES
jgi:hypothetical protein